MRNKLSVWVTSVTAAVGIILMSATAYATAILDFGVVAPTAGTISYAGGANPLVGAGISVDNAVGLGTPLNNGVTLNCIGCVLNFTTGNLSGSDATHWFFSGGGTISLKGGTDADSDGIAGDDPGESAPGTTLFLGTFSSAKVTDTGSGGELVDISVFTDTKDPTILGFYGLPTNIPYTGVTNISFLTTAPSAPGAFTSNPVLSGDITNTPTPEPGTLMLLGSGLTGLAYLVIRRRKTS